VEIAFEGFADVVMDWSAATKSRPSNTLRVFHMKFASPRRQGEGFDQRYEKSDNNLGRQ
jgi:hypothetical protein